MLLWGGRTWVQPRRDPVCVTRTKPKTAADLMVEASRTGELLGELITGIRECFVRVEPWIQAGKYVRACMSDLGKRNGWTIAEQVGDATPDRTQRLLNHASWDTPAAVSVIRRFVIGGLDAAGGARGARVRALGGTRPPKNREGTRGGKNALQGGPPAASPLGGGRAVGCAEGAPTPLRPRARWMLARAGTGSKGERGYAWAWIAPASPRHCLLIRRHLSPGECPSHYCHIPAGQPVSFTRLITAAGLRWPVEESFEFGKDYFGLDQSQVRLHTAITRHTVLVMAALAVCVIAAAQARPRTDTQAPPPAPIRPGQTMKCGCPTSKAAAFR